ncbi:MAG: porin PorA family protein [Corynebacterium glucuronolyticum]|nr:porin PorA family protein [Mycobacteriaceae bacterium]MDY5833795.1 porin PorA family protein [Corynebacterium glucuronolyticum]
MVRNLFIGVGAALLVLLWLLQSLITPTMANYQVQLVGDGQMRTVSVVRDGKTITATDVYAGHLDRDVSGTYLIDPKSGFPAKKATHTGLTYYFPMPSEERSYVVYDPLTGDAETLDYVDPDKRDGLKLYQYRETTPRLREMTVEPYSGIIVDAREDVHGTVIAFDEATRADALARATDAYQQHRSLEVAKFLLTVVGGGFLIVGLWLWTKRVL